MWWLDWNVFAALCLLVAAILMAIWLAIRPRVHYSEQDGPDFCELHEGKRLPKMTVTASYERDDDGFLICTLCKHSIYASDICENPVCPTTLMMKRLGIEK